MGQYNRLKELTVLYIEDELDVMEEVEDILTLKVGTLFTAQNGKEALEVYAKNTIDIIITDIQMPTMDGLEMIEILRKENLDIPIVITSAFTEVDFLKRAIDLHVDKYITKPIDIAQLFSVLNRASEVIFQKRKVEERDKVIKKVLDMHPYYSLLIDEENIKNINNELLAFLGYKDEKEFLCSHIENDVECISYSSIDDLTSIIIDIKNKALEDDLICLKSKDQTLVKYLLKPYYFEETNLFLIAFFEKEAYDTNTELQACKANSICQACNL